MERLFAIPSQLLDLAAHVDQVGVGAMGPAGEVLTLHDVVVDVESHVVRRGGVEIDLTATEFRLLAHFAANVGRIMSKRRLLEVVWGFEGYDPNVVEVHVSALRRKLGRHGAPLICTVRGFGYIVRATPAAA